MSGGMEMKKVMTILLTGVILMSGLIFTMNSLDNKREQVVEQSEEVVQDNLPKLHWYHEDKYPTKEDLQRFSTFKGQFPLETAELHNFNEQ
jgi:hypothetical protein